MSSASDDAPAHQPPASLGASQARAEEERLEAAAVANAVRAAHATIAPADTEDEEEEPIDADEFQLDESLELDAAQAATLGYEVTAAPKALPPLPSF